MGAWIEILETMITLDDINVAPYMGAWIEMHPLRDQPAQA